MLPASVSFRAQLPYDAIASVDCREEVYVSYGLVTVQHAFSLVTRDGVRLPLGVMAASFLSTMRRNKSQSAPAVRSSTVAQCEWAASFTRWHAMCRHGRPNRYRIWNAIAVTGKRREPCNSSCCSWLPFSHCAPVLGRDRNLNTGLEGRIVGCPNRSLNVVRWGRNRCLYARPQCV